MINFYKVQPGSTIYIPFESFASSTGAPITITGLATSDILVYKDGNMTQRASASGFTLLDTDGIDIDGITGIHGFSIDLSDNTTADFWASGSRYLVVVSTITVDSQTMSFLAATFRIGEEGSVLDTTIATLSSQTSFTLTNGPAEDNALVGREVVIHDAASAVQMSFGIISAYTGSTKTVTLAAAPTFTIAAKDNISVMRAMPLQPTTAGRTLDVTSTGEAGIDWANIGGPTTTVNLSGTTIGTATALGTDAVNSTSLAASAGAELQALITGGAYALSTDANGRIRIVDGTGAGEIDTTSGAIAHVVLTDTATTLTNAPSDSSGVTTLLSRLTAARAGYMDNINNANLANVPSFPNNFPLLGINASGHISRVTLADTVTTLTNIADAWDVTLSAHLTSGTTGAALNAAGSAGDPWSTTVPGLYGAGTAGFLLGTYLDAAISGRATNAGVWANGTRTLSALGFALAAADFGTDWLTATGLASSAVTEIRDAITGGSYALSTDANGRIRIVDGTAAGELDTASGLVTLAASQTFSTTGAVGSVTGNVGGNVVGSIGSLATQAKADVNAELLDVMNGDTYAIPGIGTPTDTPTLAEILRWIYKDATNKHDQDTNTGLQQLYSRAGVVEQKRVVTDAAGLTTVGALVAA